MSDEEREAEMRAEADAVEATEGRERVAHVERFLALASEMLDESWWP